MCENSAEMRKSMESENLINELPKFKYHPNPLKTGAFIEEDEPFVCDCCGKETLICYSAPFYSVESIDIFCPECIANGEAAKKFDGEFQDAYSTDEVSDEAKTEELIYRTPGYCGWQQEYWRAHCDDYCAYLGGVGTKELKEMNIFEEVLDDDMLDDTAKQWVRDGFVTDGSSIQGYLFQCLHCGKHLVWVDSD